MSLPILYTFRRCPYAIRARMGLYYAGIAVRVREVVLKDKPQALFSASPKATVPVLVLERGGIIEESLDIIYYALSLSDQKDWSNVVYQAEPERLIHHNDTAFKALLDNYKYPQNAPKQDPIYYRSQAELFLQALEDKLQINSFLLCDHITLADVAIFPFIRQFAMVDKAWFDKTPYPGLRNWLSYFIHSALFNQIMTKYSPWQGEKEPILAPSIST